MSGRPAVVAMTAATLAGLGVYVRIVRPWTKRWGATDEEVTRSMPGDDIVQRADYVATRAITIRATPEDVWPWLVQIGSGRAGWYSYDRLDNGGRPSATKVMPEYQALAIDELVPMIPGEDVGVWVKEIEPGRRMLWWDHKGEYSWEWTLEPVAASSTRLVSRLRATYPPLLSTRTVYTVVATTGDIVMMRRCLLGIRDRAETATRSRAADDRHPRRSRMNAPIGIRLAAVGAAAFTAGWAGVGTLTWLRYGQQREDLGSAGPIDDAMPDPEVDECHQVHVDAPADVTFAAAAALDLQASPINAGVLALRTLPARLRGEVVRVEASRASSQRPRPSAGDGSRRSRDGRS